MNSVMQPVQDIIRQAVRWRLLGLLLERPRTNWLSEIKGLACETDDPHLREAAEAASEATEGTYLMLFGEGGFVSPREITYKPMEDPGQILGNIADYYKSFAYKPRAEDPLDHIAIEAGFIGYMWLKEASAFSDRNSEFAKITHSARDRFIETHFTVIAEPLGERLKDTGFAYLTSTALALLELTNLQEKLL